jgi:ribulose 1,5-bisphosphate carboxylase large subunit-like protein
MSKLQTRKVSAYGIIDFTKEITPLILDGYEFDYSTNEYCPATYGGLIEAVMVKPDVNTETNTEVESDAETEDNTDANTEVKTDDNTDAQADAPRKRGRPARAS